MEYLTPLEKMPPVIVPLVAEYLSIKDLAACCAVSSTMRVLFDVDEVWRPRCVRGLAEYLRTTPCQVEPAFTSPESDNSTLSDISEWRMAFMRENHLRNNWRQQNYKEECIGERTMIPIGFLSNDHLVVRSECGFEIQDFRISPAQPALEPVTFDRIMKYFEIEVCNGLIIVHYYSLVLVYKADFLQEKCLLCNVFFCDEAFKEPLDKSYIIKLSRKQSPSFGSLDLVGEFVVAFNKKESSENVMIIWNYVTGEKIKEEHSPIKIKKKWCSNSNILVFCVYKEGRENTHSFIAYSLTKLAFLPFKVTVKLNLLLFRNDVATYNNFVLIRINDNCTIYNLETCKTLLSCECIQLSCYVLHDRFVFSGKDGVMRTFDPVTEILTVLPIDFVDYVNFTYDRYIHIQHKIPNTDQHLNITMWEIDRHFKIISKFSNNFFINFTCINKAVSRCVAGAWAFSKVVSFW